MTLHHLLLLMTSLAIMILGLTMDLGCLPVPGFTISLDSEIPRQRLASGPQAHVRGQAWVFGGDPQNVRVLLNNRTNTRLTTVGLHPDNRRNNDR